MPIDNSSNTYSERGNDCVRGGFGRGIDRSWWRDSAVCLLTIVIITAMPSNESRHGYKAY